MLENDKNLGNIEVKTPGPLSSSADRSINEDEETLSKSGSSSSTGSSPSDLRERLRHYSSPNQATQLTNHAITINRRLSQKRDTHFHRGADKIEEIEEKEEPESSLNVIPERGARARRRAKLRLQNQTMVVSKPTEKNVLDTKSNSNDDRTFNKSSMIESRSSQSEQRSTLMETLNSPLSGRTLPILGPYRSKRNHSGTDSSRSHPPLLHLYSGVSRENSPKNKVDVQPLSPISLTNRPMRFGGYRPQAGVILQNLSSGSEPESSHETVFIQRIEHLIPITSPASSNHLPPLSSRRSSVPREVSEPSRNEVLSEINFLQDSSDRLTSTPLSSSRTPRDSFYRMGGSSRSLRNPFVGSVRIESASTKTKAETPRRLECGVINFEKTGQTPRNEHCIDSSRWKEVRASSAANSLKSSVFKNPLPREDNSKCKEAEETETSSVASAFKELFDEKFPEQPKEDLSSRESYVNQTSNSTVHRQKFTNVPTLALNSQEMSCITSPVTKASSERRLDTDALMMALSKVSLKQQIADETSANVCSECSAENNFPTSRSRFNGSEMSYGSSLSRRSKIPVKMPTNRSKSTSQNVSSSPEGIQSCSERNDEESFRSKNDVASNMERIQLLSKECQVESARTAELSRFRESLSAVKNYFGESVSITSDGSTNNTSRDQNKNSESETSERMNLELKDVRSKDCLSPLQIPSDDDRPDDTEDTQNETYRVNNKNSCESVNESKTGDNSEIQNSSDNQSVNQKVDDDGLEDHESSTGSRNYQTKYTNTYEGEVCEETTQDKGTTPMESQIGDGGCQKSSRSSSEDEEFGKMKRTAHNRDKLRFSMERLAAEQLRKNINPEQNTITYFTEKMYDAAQSASSTSKLHHGYERTRDSPRFRKSQDRFPFTISEKTSVSSVKFMHPGRLTNMDQGKKSPDRSYYLVTHPSITRLANSGFEDTPADIIDYVTRTEQGDREIKSYGMKGLVQRFSARLRRSKKLDQVKPDTNTTSVIYENRAYREEHESLTGSESSLLKGLRMYGGMGEPRYTNGDSPDEKSSIVSDQKSSERPYRRYDGDDLWVRTFEKSGPGSVRGTEVVETQKELDECKSTRDPYSVFFVKNARETSVREFLPENESKRLVSEERRNRVKFGGSSLAVVPKKSDEDILTRNRKFENVKRNRNVGNGCLCLQFYRMIIPVSFRTVSKHQPRDNRRPVKKKSRFSLQRKKG